MRSDGVTVMHRFTFMTFVSGLLAIVCFAGCTPYIYGVPQPQWEQMSQGQKDEAISGYNERERIREQSRQIEIVRQARDAEVKVAEALRREETMHQRVEGIYAGTSGQLGDLIQVTISGGQMLIEWKYQNYQPIAFKIANGETHKVDVVAVPYSYYVAPEHSELLVKYQDGMLLIDGNESTWDRAARVLYEKSWQHGGGATVNTKSKLDLKNVHVGIKVIPHLRNKMVY